MMFDSKRLIVALIIMTFLSVAFCSYAGPYIQNANAQNNTSAKTNTTASTDYRQYSNSTLGIKIEVPADWLYKEVNNTAVTFVSAPNNTNHAVVVVDIEKVPTGMSLGTFTQGTLKDLQQNIASFHLITSNSITLSNQIVFTSLSAVGGHDLREGVVIWMIKDNKAYIITYRAEPGLGSFTTQFPIVSHMIKSFQVS